MKKVPYEKSFAHLKPWAVDYWSPDNKLGPEDVSADSKKKFKFDFVTPNGIPYSWHSCLNNVRKNNLGFFTPPAERRFNGMLVVPGFNDFASVYPSPSADWHPTRNGDLMPSHFSPRSSRRVFWLGPCGHEWDSTIHNKAMGHGCPYCSGQKVLRGFNDMPSSRPRLFEEWNYSRNIGVDPYQISPSSGVVVWWVCSNRHEWRTSVCNRVRGDLCPYCSGKRVLSGFNDLAAKNPELASQWHPTKNGDLAPSEVAPFSNKKVWWICEEGHEWEAEIAGRSSGRGCSTCSLSIKNSKPELYLIRLLDFISGCHLPSFIDIPISFTSIDGHKTISRKEFFVDYDGSFWHKDSIDRDTRKTNIILNSSDNHYIIRVREQSNKYPLPLLDIHHPRLLQLSSKADEPSLDSCAEKIQGWIDKMTS